MREDRSRPSTDVPLRRRLFLLTACAILPLALMAGIGLYALAEQHDAQVERVGLELARSVANAIDSELRSSIAVLETLTTTPTLENDDLPGFLDRARRVVGPKHDWAAIQVTDAAGNLLVDTRYDAGAPLPALADRVSFERVLNTRAPAVGNLRRYSENDWLFSVRAPVLKFGAVRYVVSALLHPEAIREALTRHQVPHDWVISIMDANGLRVARSRAHEDTIGGRLSETVEAVVNRSGSEGFGIAYSLEGERIFTPYCRLASTGWVAVLGLPTALVDAAAYRSLAVYGGGILLSIALGTLGALWVAHSIARPIAELGAAAEAMGRREPPRPPETFIREIRRVGAALKSAAEALTRSEAERENLLRKERRARETAEAADRAKEEFLAVLSHELRTPLNAVYGWARMLQTGQVRDEALVARAMDAIVRNADVQVRLIDDLLDLSRITSGKMRIDLRLVEMPAVIQGALDAVRPASLAKGIVIQTVLEPDVGPVAGDAGRLQQVVWNLLMNAIKFTPRGGQVWLQLQRVSAHVQIVVKDTGQGIAPEMLPHVFERFRQADSSSTRTHGGLGLGLALVKHIVEAHGGTAVAQSPGTGEGATFVVTLPVAAANFPVEALPRVPATFRESDAISNVVRLDGLHVLLADDDRDALALAEAILTDAGADVRTCLSARAALELLRQWRPDVLVSDIEMPGEDGHSLIRKVRKLGADEGGNTPAIALTAYGRPQDRLRSLAVGFNMHVPKPVDPGELTAIIAGVAGQPDRPRAS